MERSGSLKALFTNTRDKAADVGLLKLFALARIGLAYATLHTITFGHVLFAPLLYPHSFWTPVSMAFWLGGPPEVATVQWLALLAIISTVLLGLGAFTRINGPLCVVSACMISCISFSYGRLNHNTNTVILLALVFSFCDWGHYFSLDSLWRRLKNKVAHLVPARDPEWPITVTLAVFALPYFTTGFFKVIKGHFVEPGYIAALIKYKQTFWLQHGTIPEWTLALQNFMIRHSSIGDVLAIATLFIETLFFVALFSRRARLWVLALALILHSSITLTTKIYFIEHMFMLALLLLLCLALHLRDRHIKPVEKLFPAMPVPEKTVKPFPAPHWKTPVFAYMAAILLVVIIPWLPLPQIPLEYWMQLGRLRSDLHLFATDTYIFDYDTDLYIGLWGWLLGSGVLVYCIAEAAWRQLLRRSVTTKQPVETTGVL